jgi:hypothetical protein
VADIREEFLEAFPLDTWQEVEVSPESVVRAMKEQRNAVARIEAALEEWAEAGKNAMKE